MKLKIDFIPREQKVYEILKAFKKEKKTINIFLGSYVENILYYMLTKRKICQVVILKDQEKNDSCTDREEERNK
jgi:hypothetical protein